MKLSAIVVCILCCLLIGTTYAEEVSQWRGLQRDGHYPDTGLLRQWPEQGPKLRWSASDIGSGWGSASVGATGIFVVGTFDREDHLIKLDLDGKVIWKRVYGPTWTASWPGSRCTPTVTGGRVYVTSGSGQVVCMDAQSGASIWSIDGIETFGGQQGIWGTAESPLVVEDKVFYTPGGERTTLVALDKLTGAILVKNGTTDAVVNVTAKHIFAVDSHSGEMLWHFDYNRLPHSDSFDGAGALINCSSPIHRDGYLFVTSGYDHTAVMLKIRPGHTGVEELWQQRLFDNHHGGVVWIDDHLYGSNWESNTRGNWLCVEARTGAIQYDHPWKTKGSIITAERMLYCYEERSGHVALVEATPEAFEVASSFRVVLGEKQHWAHPCIYDKTLYIRHGSALMAYDIDAGAG